MPRIGPLNDPHGTWADYEHELLAHEESLDDFWDSLTAEQRGKINAKLDAADAAGVELAIYDAEDLRRLLVD